jgi:hypothetical protein
MSQTVTIPLRPWLAALLSLVIPGMGEMYCGEKKKGLLILTGSILTLYLCGLAPLLSAAHAWRMAARLRQREVELKARRGSSLDGLGDAAEAVGDLLD